MQLAPCSDRPKRPGREHTSKKLKQLKKLKDEGILNDAEYEEKRAALVAQI